MKLVHLALKEEGGYRTGPVVAAAFMIGVGMGGFVDGIVFHQILQWHEMLSAQLPPDTLLRKSVNMFWDGIFHAFTWTMTAVGIAKLWSISHQRDILHSTALFVGGLLLGWGLFNLVEGLLDHYLFKLHNVREKSPNRLIWNHIFLASGILFSLIGWLLILKERSKQNSLFMRV